METALTIDQKEALNNARTLIATARDMEIKSDGDLAMAGEVLLTIKRVYKTVDGKKKEATKKLKEALDIIEGWFDPSLGDLKDAEGELKEEIKRYNLEQAEARRREQERLQKLAEKQAAEQQKSIDKEADRLEMIGDEAGAEQLRAQKESVLVPTPAVPEPAKVSGAGMRKVRRWEVTDFKLLDDRFKQENTKALGEEARKTTGDATLPGVRFFDDYTVVGR